ncbi:hypothetical protein [Corticibacter populi]|uniref:hypothetical protein n=1 Tax=Corticibacter populi TaxID=1550736 RepID=UPI0013C30269|nr:hypothetical protein [Corticibacter populi]
MWQKSIDLQGAWNQNPSNLSHFEMFARAECRWHDAAQQQGAGSHEGIPFAYD